MFASPPFDTKPPSRYPRREAFTPATTVFHREAAVLTLGLIGLEGHVVRVTARLEEGPVAFQIAGLPELRVRETRVRVRAALESVGMALPAATLAISFDRPELISGGSADAAIAIAILAVLRHVDEKHLQGTALVGELSLTGSLRPVRGVLPMLLAPSVRDLRLAIVPMGNRGEAASATSARAALAGHLSEIVRHFREGIPLERPARQTPTPLPPAVPDLSELRGMPAARRALEIAAAGGHAVLVVGPPGAGKTMLARRLPGILPELTEEEALEVTSIHSVAGLVTEERGLIQVRPFRAPHHTVSTAGLVGGGAPARPGEVTLAHNGALFLDEVTEFRGDALESLAMVLREGRVTVFRGGVRTSYPAEPLLVLAANPCPCGYLGNASGRCACTPERVAMYRTRLRRPLIERTEVRIALHAQSIAEIRAAERGEPSAVVRARVTAARAMQAERASITGTRMTNAGLALHDLGRVAAPDAIGTQLLAHTVEALALSETDRARILRVARTIADLDGRDAVTAAHVTEAIGFVTLRDASAPAPAAAGGDDAA